LQIAITAESISWSPAAKAHHIGRLEPRGVTKQQRLAVGYGSTCLFSSGERAWWSTGIVR